MRRVIDDHNPAGHQGTRSLDRIHDNFLEVEVEFHNLSPVLVVVINIRGANGTVEFGKGGILLPVLRNDDV